MSIPRAISTIAIGLIWAVLVGVAIGQEPAQSRDESRPMPSPEVPYYDWNACPFESCAYKEWTARKPAIIYDTWKQNRREIARVSRGEAVTGLTGVVITYKPGTIRIDRDLPGLKLNRGDTILTFAYRGEGLSAAWFKGRYYDAIDIGFAKWPDGSGCYGPSCAATYLDLGKKEWWAQIRLKSGRTGWVNMDTADFDGVDLTAGSE